MASQLASALQESFVYLLNHDILSNDASIACGIRESRITPDVSKYFMLVSETVVSLLVEACHVNPVIPSVLCMS